MKKSVSLKSVCLGARRGFTLLEILLVVGIIAILAGIVILAINPTKQLGDARNAQRRADVLTILNAVYQYTIDTNGTIPATITSTSACVLNTMEIATGTATTTAAPVQLYTYLVGSAAASSTYIVSIPRDPNATSTTDATAKGTGYAIVKTTSGRVTVCAPLAENAATISVTR